jgi:two-component system OmpR family response regulator
MSRPVVLIVHSKTSVRDLLRRNIPLDDVTIEEVEDGRQVLERVTSRRFDLIVVDLVSPRIDGVTLCRSIRNEGMNRITPIMMVSACDSESDKVLGLESGADDYLAEPFEVRVFRARAAALLRRSRPAEPGRSQGSSIEANGLLIDPVRRLAFVDGHRRNLTTREFDVLHLLASRSGIVFSRAALLSRLWRNASCVSERAVDVVVNRLRRKIERDPRRPIWVLTTWGVGYKFVDHDAMSKPNQQPLRLKSCRAANPELFTDAAAITTS